MHGWIVHSMASFCDALSLKLTTIQVVGGGDEGNTSVIASLNDKIFSASAIISSRIFGEVGRII